MKSPFRSRWFSLLVFALVLVLSGHCAEAKITPGQSVPEEVAAQALDRTNPVVQAAVSVQERHTSSLMSAPDVVGTAVGLTDDGRPAVLVFTKRTVAAGVIPEALEGIPVRVHVTGEFLSMEALPKVSPFVRGKPGPDPKTRFERPVPIGVSTGNEGECSAGTIGARVKDTSGGVYALSNNHVYALENGAAIGSRVLQPGRYDTGCSFDTNNVIGNLYDYEPIVFSTSASNRIDAAIASSSTSYLGNATPFNGYGVPRSTIVPEELNQGVQKYGRTTSLTRGSIVGINATVNIGYDSGVARFTGQVIVLSRKGAFLRPGDSGSLVVTDPGRYPVALLFAGTSDGRYAICNPIDEVLQRFGVTIDGE